jgi:hypothetical protein
MLKNYSGVDVTIQQEYFLTINNSEKESMRLMGRFLAVEIAERILAKHTEPF